MRLVAHAGSCYVRYHANAPAFYHVSKLPPSFTQKPFLHVGQASFPRRNLSLSSRDPIIISDDRQTITLRLKNNEKITQKISPTPKANCDKLANALASLLSTPETPKTGDLSLKHSPGLSFGTPQWQLDPLGDAIHRHTAHPSARECEQVEELIMSEAERMNHHPHITRGTIDGENKYMTITCTSHSPRGLSIRDTRLANKINATLDAFNVTEPMSPDDTRDLDEVKKHFAAHRERMIALNRQQISEALESCSCGSAKIMSPTSSQTSAP
ncbi:uncharacterized protein A1O5_10137 [Cladophialophora psammophila CBS 110553]|uniref:4a-hydroxytetrahydrobiopterin dehydratase n=1 Tax=Cladophialophora psammophila CBS 110553 TaxID=1182543 RepID=W9WFQ8_9EURO|nr:uncharacterized protein A1O5_10137 [Cladophialophora psammophila CBS 110553]EXJ66942.1 hypothetical protein A1O5_10137 [Cladophialophora psammophila CBS 110553]